MHSHCYKYPTKAMKGKTVLVVGGGESASDVATEVCEKAARTILAIRSGTWFQDRTVGAEQPADMVFTKHQRLLGFSDYQSWLVWIGMCVCVCVCAVCAVSACGGTCAHAIAEFSCVCRTVRDY